MLISLIPSLPFIPSIVSGTSLLAADGCWTSTLSWNSLSHSFVFFNWWYEYRWSFMRILAYGRKIYTICGKMQGKNLSLVHMMRVWEMLARKRTCLLSTCEGLRNACKEKNMSLFHMWGFEKSLQGKEHVSRPHVEFSILGFTTSTCTCSAGFFHFCFGFLSLVHSLPHPHSGKFYHISPY